MEGCPTHVESGSMALLTHSRMLHSKHECCQIDY